MQGREDYERCDHKVAGPRSRNCGQRKPHACEVQSEIRVRMTLILLSWIGDRPYIFSLNDNVEPIKLVLKVTFGTGSRFESRSGRVP
jgi:hypothetical protein